MYSENIYILSFLPGMISLAEPAEISIKYFIGLLKENDTNLKQASLAEAIFLSDDLLQRDAKLAGSDEPIAPSVLNEDQITGDEDLPDYLFEDNSADLVGNVKIPGDSTWNAYFHYVNDLAIKHNNKFLQAWVKYEVTLRNASAEARARDLGLEGADYTVATDLEGYREEMTSVVNEWSSAKNPLEAQRALDRGRWEWIGENEQHFSFSDNELVAYAAKLLLNVRWQRLNKAMENRQ